jgi:integrase
MGIKPRQKGAALRRMEPFTRDDLQLIRAAIRTKGSTRDAALLEVGIDTMLRIGDLLNIRVRDVRDFAGGIVDGFIVVQDKTDSGVKVNLTPKARTAIARLIEAEGKWNDDFLFTREGEPHGQALSEVAMRLVIKRWAKLAHRDPRKYSGHSLRRTKAAFIYSETKNVALVGELLGHTSIAHTSKYLGITTEEASKTALKYDL